MDPTAPSASDAERDIEMLRELAEIGLALAREVADLASRRMKEARESGWDHGLPSDPGAAFGKLAQSVRRSIALKAKLADDRAGGGRGPAGSLFASAGPPLDLAPDFAAARQAPPSPADRLVSEALSERDGRETIATDLGPLTEPRERLFEIPMGPAQAHAAILCQNLGLDPARLRLRAHGYAVAPDSADPHNPEETPLSQWRPSAAPILRAAGWTNVDDLPPMERRRTKANGARLE